MSVTTVPVAKPRLNLSLVIVTNILLIAHLLVYLVGAFPDFDAASRVGLWVGTLAAVIFVAAAIQIQRAEITPSERWHVPFVAGAFVLLLFLALIPVPQATFTYLAHVHTMLTFALTLWILYRTLFDSSQGFRIRRLWIVVGIAVIVVVSLVRLYGLSYYPFVDVQDEPWVTAWTLNWLRTGHLGDPTMAGLGDPYYAYPRFYWLMGLWIQLVGVGLWQERILGFLLIFPVIGITFWVARAWYGKAAAFLTAVFMLCSAVLFSAARVRHDIGLAIAVAASLGAFTLGVKRRSPFWHFFAGFIMLCGMFAHYHAAGIGIAVLVGLYAPRYFAQWRDRATNKHFWLPEAGAWLFIGGALLGTLAVVCIQMLPDDLPGWLWSLHHFDLYSDTTREFFISFFGNIFNVGWFSFFEFILVAGAVILALRRRTMLDVSLLLILLLGLIALAEMGSGAIYYYILPLVPVYSLLVGRMFLDLREKLPTRVTRLQAMTAALLMIPLLGVTTATSLHAVTTAAPLNPPPPPAVAWIRSNIPTSDKIAADIYYYFWLDDYPFINHLTVENFYPDNIDRYPTLSEAWNAVDMDVLVVDPSFHRSYLKYFQPLLATGLIDQKYQVIQTIPTSGGDVTIYERRTLTAPTG